MVRIFARHTLSIMTLMLATAASSFAATQMNQAENAPAPAAVAADTAKPAAPCMMCYEQQALQKLLGQYQEIAKNGGWQEWTVVKKMRIGASDSHVATLRQILTVMGDYQSAQGATAPSDVYDTALVEAVKHFQLRHGLNATGEMTKSTQQALSVPVEQRITQIVATLQRMQENPIAAEDKFILVNLPGYTLYAIDGGKEALTMRVIVGNRANHTPLFDNVVNAVVFNPPWSVPVRIARNELIPKLRKNPSYFVNAGFVVSQDGVEVDPMSANADEGNFSFRQRPGTGNALGKIKFNIPDDYDVYLHSTSSPKLFANEDRALSHGCVRLEKPRELAMFVMGSEPGWNADKINHAYDSSTQRSVKVSSVPVHLVYWTAFVDAQGFAHFYGDVYNKDKALTNAKLEDKNAVVVAAK